LAGLPAFYTRIGFSQFRKASFSLAPLTKEGAAMFAPKLPKAPSLFGRLLGPPKRASRAFCKDLQIAERLIMALGTACRRTASSSSPNRPAGLCEQALVNGCEI